MEIPPKVGSHENLEGAVTSSEEEVTAPQGESEVPLSASPVPTVPEISGSLVLREECPVPLPKRGRRSLDADTFDKNEVFTVCSARRLNLSFSESSPDVSKALEASLGASGSASTPLVGLSVILEELIALRSLGLDVARHSVQCLMYNQELFNCLSQLKKLVEIGILEYSEYSSFSASSVFNIPLTELVHVPRNHVQRLPLLEGQVADYFVHEIDAISSQALALYRKIYG